MQEYLQALKIVTTHGVRGEVKAELYCDDFAFLAKIKTLFWDAAGSQPVKILSARAQGQMALLTLEGITDMDAARAKVGRILYMAHDAVPLPKGHYFVADLIGCRVLDADSGREYGTVKSVTHPGAQDIYTVSMPNGREAMFPGVPEFLKKLSPEEGVILVKPIPGMFEDAVNGDEA